MMNTSQTQRCVSGNFRHHQRNLGNIYKKFTTLTLAILIGLLATASAEAALGLKPGRRVIIKDLKFNIGLNGEKGILDDVQKRINENMWAVRLDNKKKSTIVGEKELIHFDPRNLELDPFSERSPKSVTLIKGDYYAIIAGHTRYNGRYVQVRGNSFKTKKTGTEKVDVVFLNKTTLMPETIKFKNGQSTMCNRSKHPQSAVKLVEFMPIKKMWKVTRGHGDKKEELQVREDQLVPKDKIKSLKLTSLAGKIEKSEMIDMQKNKRLETVETDKTAYRSEYGIKKASNDDHYTLADRNNSDNEKAENEKERSLTGRGHDAYYGGTKVRFNGATDQDFRITTQQQKITPGVSHRGVEKIIGTVQRRRLTNQSLIDRFIRVSERTQSERLTTSHRRLLAAAKRAGAVRVSDHLLRRHE